MDVETGMLTPMQSLILERLQLKAQIAQLQAEVAALKARQEVANLVATYEQTLREFTQAKDGGNASPDDNTHSE